MAEIQGYVISHKGQRARVKVDKEGSTIKKGLPQYLDCWNSIEASEGLLVEVEMRDLDEKKAKMITYGIPVLTLIAGAIFGNSFAIFLKWDRFWSVFVGSVLWFLIGINFSHTFSKDVASKGEQPVITKVIYDE